MSEEPAGAPKELTLQRAQAEVDASIVALGGYWPPLANLARLFEECGELARAINQAYGGKRVKPSEAPAAAGEELGDVLYVTLVLANSLQLDATAALEAVLEKVRRRAGEMAAGSRLSAGEDEHAPAG